MQTVVNLVALESNETVATFLQRMQDMQLEQTKHAASPRLVLMEALGPEDGPLVPWIANIALFNWLGSRKTGASTGERVTQVLEIGVNRTGFGLFIVGGMASPDTMYIKLRGATIGEEQARQMTDELGSLVLWLLSQDHEHVQAKAYKSK